MQIKKNRVFPLRFEDHQISDSLHNEFSEIKERFGEDVMLFLEL
jgi:hypothetical protein